MLHILTIRSSRLEVFCRKGVRRNFANLTGKHLCLRLFLNKVVVLRHLAQVFCCEFCEIYKKHLFLQNSSGDCFLTITVRQIIYVFCISNQKQSNIDVQQDYFPKKEEIWLLFQVSIILFSGRKISGLYSCFIKRNVNKIFVLHSLQKHMVRELRDLIVNVNLDYLKKTVRGTPCAIYLLQIYKVFYKTSPLKLLNKILEKYLRE